MKRLIDFSGGRNFVNDDLAAIQEQLDGAYAHLRDKGAFLIEGGAITSAGGGLYNIAAAWLMLNNHVVYMPAMTGVALTANSAVGEDSLVQEASRPYTLLAVVKPGIERRRAVLLPTTAGWTTDYIALTPTGWGRTYKDALIATVEGTLSRYDIPATSMGIVSPYNVSGFAYLAGYPNKLSCIESSKDVCISGTFAMNYNGAAGMFSSHVVLALPASFPLLQVDQPNYFAAAVEVNGIQIGCVGTIHVPTKALTVYTGSVDATANSVIVGFNNIRLIKA